MKHITIWLWIGGGILALEIGLAILVGKCIAIGAKDK